MKPLALLLLLALPAAGPEQTDDPMIRWDCDRAGDQLVLEMVRPPVAKVTQRELLILSGAANFEQCHINGGSWTLLVDLVEYDSGRCEPEPDTIVSLLRNDRLVISKVLIGYNCGSRPVLSAMRISEPKNGGNPRLELCTAKTYGAESHCSQLRIERMKEAIDNGAIVTHARNGARRPH
jgi:hypothetical protein